MSNLMMILRVLSFLYVAHGIKALRVRTNPITQETELKEFISFLQASDYPPTMIESAKSLLKQPGQLVKLLKYFQEFKSFKRVCPNIPEQKATADDMMGTWYYLMSNGVYTQCPCMASHMEKSPPEEQTIPGHTIIDEIYSFMPGKTCQNMAQMPKAKYYGKTDNMGIINAPAEVVKFGIKGIQWKWLILDDKGWLGILCLPGVLPVTMIATKEINNPPDIPKYLAYAESLGLDMSHMKNVTQDSSCKYFTGGV